MAKLNSAFQKLKLFYKKLIKTLYQKKKKQKFYQILNRILWNVVHVWLNLRVTIQIITIIKFKVRNNNYLKNLWKSMIYLRF